MNKGRKFLSDLKLYSDFLGWNDEKQRYETWEEACGEVFDTHRIKYENELKSFPNLINHIEFAEKLYKEKYFLTSQRALQFRGEDMFKHNFKMFNCLVMYADKPSFLGNAFYLMLCGCGVGINMMTPFINKLPNIQKRNKGTKTFSIVDSIEGWGEAAHVLITSYLTDSPVEGYEKYQGYEIKFDYSLIRPKGSKIGRKYKSPGPEGIKQSFEKIEILLNNYVEDYPKPFKSIIAYDFFMHLANAVLSGGIRRAACNIVLSKEDEDLLYAKTGNWRENNKQRERSNNSVGLLRNQFSKEEFETFLRLNDGISDIGFVFMNNIFEVFNPCITGDSWVTTENGPKQVKDIIGNKVKLLKDGEYYQTTDKGFWETGYQPVYELLLHNGMSIKSTNNHQFLTKDGWKELKDIQPGENITISINNQNIEWEGEGGNIEEGWLIGNLIGDGTFGDEAKLCYWGDNKFDLKKKAYAMLKENTNFTKYSNHEEKYNDNNQNEFEYNRTSIQSKALSELALLWDVTKHNKTLTPKIEKSSSNFYKGVIGGLFDADGCIWESNGGITVDISQSNHSLLKQLQRMLSRLGITSTISLSNKGGMKLLPGPKYYENGEMKEYLCKNNYILRISNKTNVDLFFNTIYSVDDSKINRYKEICYKFTKPNYKTKNYSKVKSISYIGMETVYDCTVPETSCFDANGIITHNCFEIGFTPLYFDWNDRTIVQRVMDSDVTLLDEPYFKTGIQCCNLCEINGALMKDKKTFFDACKAAAIVGTLQAGYTDFNHIKDILNETIEISKKESLLGISITGWTNQPWLFDAETLQEGAKIVKETNQLISLMLGINPSARSTTVKPSGNASVILGCASGIHPEHSEDYFRVMQLNKETETAKWLEENMPFILEEGAYSETKSDWAVFVPIVNNKNTLYKNDLQGVKHLELIKLVKENWVDYGKEEKYCIIPSTSHNVSNTVIIDDFNSITDYIYEHQNSFSAVSFLSLFGDKDWNQSPNTSVLSFDKILETYGKGSLFASGLIVDGLHYFDQNLWEACECVIDRNKPITGTREQVLLKKHWVESAKRFAKNYFKKDIQKMIYCIKDIHLLHKWDEINRKFPKSIDFTEILTKPHYIDVDTMGAISCNGGSCEII